MAIERTFSIIKPDATERNLTGAVNALIEKAGLGSWPRSAFA
jgi:Nucleoside diphosphate kinase